ncbi:MAG: Gfo/Idh/MocA family oxidoreductase [Bacteroidetes bacterium]|nr:Gfo/Idh/MocA family oxidoreductase [Bacteroidota bacterium]
MELQSNETRRRFLKKTGAATAAVAIGSPASLFTRASASFGPNDEIRFGVIGCKGMGFADARSLSAIDGVVCGAICDVDDSVLAQRSDDVEKMTGNKPRTYKDYRKLLENKDLDFVVIGTPDHWHCLMGVEALEAGKHVYLEKPLANSLQECDILLNAARAHGNRILQMGQWQRSGPHWRHAVDFVQSGALGNIRTVKTWAYQGWMKPVPVQPDSAPPPGVDYDMWLGPAPNRPFNPNRFHFNFRWFWDYAGGLMTDWGVHIIDYALYGMGATTPKSVMATGGKFAYPDDASETPDTLQAVFEFDGFTMLWEHATGIDLGPYQRTHGVAFIGNNGTLVVDRGGWEVLPEDEPVQGSDKPMLKMEVPTPERVEGSDLDRHTQNFVACLRGDATPHAGIEVGHAAATVAHMGNIAFKTGRKVYWDAEAGEFRDDAEANVISRATYRAPWTLPSY